MADWLVTDILIFSNVIMLALPIRSVWHLKLPRMTRIGLIGIFGVGFLCVFSLAQISVIKSLNQPTSSSPHCLCQLHLLNNLHFYYLRLQHRIHQSSQRYLLPPRALSQHHLRLPPFQLCALSPINFCPCLLCTSVGQRQTSQS